MKRPVPGASGAPPSQTIYVIEDDDQMREFLSQVLGKLGWNVKTYHSAEPLLGNGPAHGNGCLIVDVKLPGMSGIEFLNARTPELKRLPAIVMTAFGDVGTAVRAMKAGAVDFIEKPVTLDQLRGTISRALLSAREEFRDSVAVERIAALTPRQREILSLIVDGNTNKTIAAILGINQRTVEAHRAAIMQRVGTATVPELLRVVLAAMPRRHSSS